MKHIVKVEALKATIIVEAIEEKWVATVIGEDFNSRKIVKQAFTKAWETSSFVKNGWGFQPKFGGVSAGDLARVFTELGYEVQVVVVKATGLGPSE